jgi:arylsulfatase A-like enzyme/cytochrome c-type biogenesis protein CcmH/NrfG
VGRLSIFLCFLALLTPAAGQTAAPRKAPDIFLITIDTLRADHVGCYGYQKIETPALDALCADGVHFTQAFTHSPITNTSHITILTGLLPSAHGVTDFGVPLSPQHVTWAELLKKHGYQNAAFIGAVILDSDTLAPGLDRGFDFYDNFPAKTETKERWGRVERRGMEVVQHAENWLDKHRTGSRFVWVHLYDPHDPYEPPPPFAEKYKEHPYDGEIAYADSALAHLIAYLKKNGAYANAMIIVVGDHGEGLGEHGEDTHGLFLYDSTLHVPLIVKLPGATQGGGTSDVQVRTTDILPTVLALESIPTPEGLTGDSLLPLLKGTTQAGRALFAETDYPLRWGWAPLRALRENNTKFIQAPRPELYDLSSDPHEQKNVYAPNEARVAALKSDIEKWESKLPENPAAKNAELADPKDKVQVQNLLHNAMLASDDSRSQDARGFLEKALQLDPKSPTALRQLGELEFAAGDYPKAAAHLKQALEIRPDDSTAAFELGQALEKSGDMAGARDALEASLKLVPSQIPARLMLGRVYLKLNDAKNAEDQFEAAQLVDSSNTEAQLGVAEAQVAQSKFTEAVPDLESYVSAHPQDAAALRLLARAYRGLGRTADADKAESRASSIRKE